MRVSINCGKEINKERRPAFKNVRRFSLFIKIKRTRISRTSSCGCPERNENESEIERSSVLFLFKKRIK